MSLLKSGEYHYIIENDYIKVVNKNSCLSAPLRYSVGGSVNLYIGVWMCVGGGGGGGGGGGRLICRSCGVCPGCRCFSGKGGGGGCLSCTCTRLHLCVKWSLCAVSWDCMWSGDDCPIIVHGMKCGWLCYITALVYKVKYGWLSHLCTCV